MGLEAFASIAKIFAGKPPSDAERASLLKEALLLTLSRATTADVKIDPVEVEAVQALMQSVTGEDVTAADVRVAAASELYETASLDAYLSAVGKKLLPDERTRFINSVAEIIRSDRRVTEREIEFFNWVVSALKASPSEIAGLVVEK